ncbi:response regulator [Ferrovibrio sp.]|uniref:response regulator n=1 Tax=Ferrovibrio sp. TaxID=1917215 RepID=UPI003D0A89C1
MAYLFADTRRRPKPPLPSAVFFWITAMLPVLLCVAFAWLFLEQRQLQTSTEERRITLEISASNLTQGLTQLLSLDEQSLQSDRDRIMLLLRLGTNELDSAIDLMRNDVRRDVQTAVLDLERDLRQLREAMRPLEAGVDGSWRSDFTLRNALLRVQQKHEMLSELVHRHQSQQLDKLQLRLYFTIAGVFLLLVIVVVRLRLAMRAEAETVRDLMEAEAALRESDRRLRALLRAATENVWIADGRFESYRFNPPLRIGKAEPKADWSSPEWIEVVHPEDRASVRSIIRAGFRRREPIRWEFRISDGEGGWRWMESRAVPELDAQGRIEQWLGLSMDTTERHVVAEQLRHAHKMEAIGALTGGIAHDFNNMLAVILGNLELLQEQDLPPQQSSCLSSAISAAERGSELTHRLLAFGRRQSLRPVVIDLAAHLPSLHNMLGRTLGSNIDVVLAYDRSPLCVKVDPAQLDNAILNLAINARDAINGAGRLTLTLDRVYGRFVDAFALGSEDAHPDPDRVYALFAVSDTGGGMSPEVMARAFDPFFTTKPVGQGSGLGLSMVHGFVRQSQGFIGVQSAPGEGTTIRIFLPVTTERLAAAAPVNVSRPASAALPTAMDKATETPAAAAIPAPAATPPAPVTNAAVTNAAVTDAVVTDAAPSGGYRILLVDDDDDVRSVLGWMLTALGHAVTEVNSGAAAMERLQAGDRFDLMITDIQMPGGLSGVDLARQVTLHRWIGHIIFLSGSEPPADSLKRQTGHNHAFLRKPIRKQDLINTIETTMAQPESWS